MQATNWIEKRREAAIKKAGGKEKYLAEQRRRAGIGGSKTNAENNPGNFKNNTERARLAGIKSGEARRKKSEKYANEPDGMGVIADEVRQND